VETFSQALYVRRPEAGFGGFFGRSLLGDELYDFLLFGPAVPGQTISVLHGRSYDQKPD
jgi:hypothetical protein